MPETHDEEPGGEEPQKFQELPEPKAGEIRELYQNAARNQSHANNEYWMNHSFLRAEQYIEYNPITRSIEDIAINTGDGDRVQATVDHMLPISRQIISKLNSRPLQFQVLPTAADDATIRAARISESIVRAIHRTHGWEDVREDASWAAWKGGTAAICVEWDPSASQPLGVTETGRSFGTGDTKEMALSITDFVIEPGVRRAETARWWIRGVALPPKTVQARFRLPKEPEADATAGLSPQQRKLIASHATNDENDRADLTLILTYFERPNPLRPEGRIVHVVGNKIVEESEWNFPFKDRLNLVIIRETQIDGQWSGHTVLSSSRPIQKAINQSWSSIIEHVKLAGNARLPIPERAVEAAQQFSDLPGEIIVWPDDAQFPKWLAPAQMSSWTLEQPDRMKMEMEDILGLHDVSRGRAPSNIESGLGLSILAEQDATPIGRMSKEQAGAWGRVASMVLEIYSDRVKETRESVVRVPGRLPETIRWTGKNIKKQTVVEVPPDAIIPRSRAQQMDFANQAANMGLLSDPVALSRFVKLAQIPDMGDALEGLAPDVAKARRENYSMSLGQVPDPLSMDIDNHNIHIEEHHTEMKGPGWDLLDPPIQDIYRKHVQAHAVLSAEQLAKQQAKAEVSPVLASAADATGAPALPVDVAGPIATAPAPPPSAGAGDIQEAVQASFPGIDPNIVEQGI